jgi:UDPglucose 6-dehydrogenase
MEKIKIGIVGTGYVGLVNGLGFADFGFTVTCGDIDGCKIGSLNNGNVPIYEPGLSEVFHRVKNLERVHFTCDIPSLVEESDVIFICVGTPPGEDGSADLKYVWEVARDIGKYMNNYKVVVDKSTVPVGTAREVRKLVQEELDSRGRKIPFDVVSNPEFLREGKALHDFTHPDRVVVGTESEKATEIMKRIYAPMKLNEIPFVFTTPETAELIKYAANAFLATKIAFINEMANLCEAVGGDVKKVAKAMGMDGRISDKFLHPGPGYGGSCFPKDTMALVDIAEKQGTRTLVVSSVIEANNRQKLRMVEKIKRAFPDGLGGKTVAVLGISFKQETDDVRESPSLVIIPELVKAGASVRTYDPQGMPQGKVALAHFAENITYCADEYDACAGSDATVVVTDWNQFRSMDLSRIKQLMKGNWFFDLRNLYEPEEVTSLGLNYEGVGRGVKLQE